MSDLAPVLTLAGSKGGPGKTTISAAIIATLAREGRRVVAIDADPTEALYQWITGAYEGPAIDCAKPADDDALAVAIYRAQRSAEVVVVDTGGFGNRAAAIAMTAADRVLIPVLPGAADAREAVRTCRLVETLSGAARRRIVAHVILNRRRPTLLARHFAAEVAALPTLRAGLSELVAFGEMTFSGRLPEGKAGTEIAYLVAELRELGALPARRAAA